MAVEQVQFSLRVFIYRPYKSSDKVIQPLVILAVLLIFHFQAKFNWFHIWSNWFDISLEFALWLLKLIYV